MMSVNMGWQKFFDRGQGTNLWNAGIMVGIMLSIIAGTIVSIYISKIYKNEKIIMISSQLFIGLCLSLTVIFTNSLSLAIIFFMFHEFGRGLYRPIKSAYLQDHLESKKRATLGSFESMANNFFGTIGLLMSGLIAQRFNYGTAWVISGIILVGSIPFLILKCKKRRT